MAKVDSHVSDSSKVSRTLLELYSPHSAQYASVDDLSDTREAGEMKMLPISFLHVCR